MNLPKWREIFYTIFLNSLIIICFLLVLQKKIITSLLAMEYIIYITIISIFILSYVWESILDYFNAKWFNKEPDALVNDIYDNVEYNKQQDYNKSNYNFGKLSGLFSFITTSIILIFGGFGKLDIYISNEIPSTLLQTLVFFAIVGLASTLVSIPFSYYQTFVIEEKFGFNKSSKLTFWTDTLKSLLLGAVLGGLIFLSISFFQLLLFLYSINKHL